MTTPENLTQTVHAARSGDRGAFDTLFARTMPGLVAFLRVKVGGVIAARESVHDLAQSVCREVLEDLDQFDAPDEQALRQRLFLEARRKIVDRHRYLTRRRRDVGREAPMGVQTDDEAKALLDCYATFCTPSQIVGAREELERIEAVIATLPDNQREAVAMSRIMGMEYAEIAAKLECSEAAVRGLVARGLAKLAQLLRPDGD